MTDFASLNTYIGQVTAERTAEAKSAKSGVGQGWLVAIAKVLGNIADKLGQKIVEKAQALDEAIRADKKDLTEQNAELQALAQQMTMLMSAISTIIKSIGEGEAGIARKQ